MAEGGIPTADTQEAPADVDETVSSFAEPLTVPAILAMTVEELRTEMRIRGISFMGITKPELQEMLLRELFVIKGEEETMAEPLAEEPLASPGFVAEHQPLPATVASVGFGVGARPKVPFAPAPVVLDFTLPPPARTQSPVGESESLRALEFKLQLKRLENEDRERARQSQAQERERERQFELRKLELQVAPAHTSPIAVPRVPTPAFRIESAIKLIPQFDENDVETFLITFEKIASINKFPAEKYAAILQAHLKGKALKVFTELSITECQDYQVLKEALLTAYAVVPEVYRKRFRESRKTQSETFSEFAFRLSTQFKRWAESEQAYGNIDVLRELIMMEQFNSHIEPAMRGWLIDQKPQSLSQLARLADQYLAIHQGYRNDRLVRGSHYRHGYSSGRPTWNKPEFSKPAPPTNRVEGNGNHPPSPPKSPPWSPGRQRNRVVCYYCKKPGHVMSSCHKRLAKLSNAANRQTDNSEGSLSE